MGTLQVTTNRYLLGALVLALLVLAALAGRG
jgi:hypothetical protein